MTPDMISERYSTHAPPYKKTGEERIPISSSKQRQEAAQREVATNKNECQKRGRKRGETERMGWRGLLSGCPRPSESGIVWAFSVATAGVDSQQGANRVTCFTRPLSKAAAKRNPMLSLRTALRVFEVKERQPHRSLVLKAFFHRPFSFTFPFSVSRAVCLLFE